MVGLKSKHVFHARVGKISSESSSAQFWVGVFPEDQDNFSDEHPIGWVRLKELAPQLQSIISSERESVIGTIVENGKVFKIYLKESPDAVDNIYDMRGVEILGFEI